MFLSFFIEQIPAVYFFEHLTASLDQPTKKFLLDTACGQMKILFKVRWNQKYWLYNRYCLFLYLCSSLSVVTITEETHSQRSKKCSKWATDALLEGKPFSFLYSFYPNTSRFPRGSKSSFEAFFLTPTAIFFLKRS